MAINQEEQKKKRLQRKKMHQYETLDKSAIYFYPFETLLNKQRNIKLERKLV